MSISGVHFAESFICGSAGTPVFIYADVVSTNGAMGRVLRCVFQSACTHFEVDVSAVPDSVSDRIYARPISLVDHPAHYTCHNGHRHVHLAAPGMSGCESDRMQCVFQRACFKRVAK